MNDKIETVTELKLWHEMNAQRILALSRGKEIERLSRRIHHLRRKNKAQRVDLEISHESNRQLLQRREADRRVLLQTQVQIERLLVENEKQRAINKALMQRNMELEVLHKMTGVESPWVDGNPEPTPPHPPTIGSEVG